MHRISLAALTMTCLVLCGCNRPMGIFGNVDRHGRYSSVGIYVPSKQWTKIVSA